MRRPSLPRSSSVMAPSPLRTQASRSSRGSSTLRTQPAHSSVTGAIPPGSSSHVIPSSTTTSSPSTPFEWSPKLLQSPHTLLKSTTSTSIPESRTMGDEINDRHLSGSLTDRTADVRRNDAMRPSSIHSIPSVPQRNNNSYYKGDRTIMANDEYQNFKNSNNTSTTNSNVKSSPRIVSRSIISPSSPPRNYLNDFSNPAASPFDHAPSSGFRGRPIAHRRRSVGAIDIGLPSTNSHNSSINAQSFSSLHLGRQFNSSPHLSSTPKGAIVQSRGSSTAGLPGSNITRSRISAPRPLGTNANNNKLNTVSTTMRPTGTIGKYQNTAFTQDTNVHKPPQTSSIAPQRGPLQQTSGGISMALPATSMNNDSKNIPPKTHRASPMTRRVDQYASLSKNAFALQGGLATGNPKASTISGGLPPTMIRTGGSVMNLGGGRNLGDLSLISSARASRADLELERQMRARVPQNAWNGDEHTTIGAFTDMSGFSEAERRCRDLWRHDNKPVPNSEASMGFQKCLDLIRLCYESTPRQSYHFRRDYPSGRRPANLNEVMNVEYISDDGKGTLLMPPLLEQFQEAKKGPEVRSWSVPLVSQCKPLGGRPINKINIGSARVVGTRVVSSRQKEIIPNGTMPPRPINNETSRMPLGASLASNITTHNPRRVGLGTTQAPKSRLL